MDPITQTVGIALLLALSCHAMEPQREAKMMNSCEGWPGDGNHTQDGDIIAATSDGVEEFFDCGEDPPRGRRVMLCVSGELRTCVQGCGVPEKMLNNAVLQDGQAFYPMGSRVTYACGSGFTQTGRGGAMSERRCRTPSFSWSALRIQCEGRMCGSAGEVLNGDVVYSGTDYGHTATVVCASGHTMVGKAVRTCLAEGWSGHLASCEAVHCTEPETNAVRASGVHDSYAYREVIFYRCPEGHLQGQRAIWCTEKGTWSHPAPTCINTTAECPRPNVSHANLSGARVPPFRHRALLRFICHPGYYMEGSSMTSCSVEGNWTPPLPKCTRH